MSEQLKLLLRNLESLDPDSRKEAIKGLTDSESIEALQALERTSTQDTSIELRFLARKAVERIQARMSLPDDENKGIQETREGDSPDLSEAKIRAIRAAAATRRPGTLKTLKNMLFQERNPRVIGTILLAIGYIGGKDELPVFSTHLKHKDPTVRLNCVKAMTYLDESLSYPLFVLALTDKNARVASRAYGYLRKLGKENILSLLKNMAQSRHRWMRKVVARACGRLNNPEVIPILRELASRESDIIRAQALKSIKTLTELGNKQAEILLSELKEASEQLSRQAVAFAIRVDPSMGGYDTSAEIIATRSAGFILPAGQKDEPLNSKKPSERMQALQDIVDEGDPSRIPEILTRLSIEKNLKVKAALLAALGELGGAEEIPHLKQYLLHPHARIRATAVENIGRLAPPDIDDILRDFLDDEDNRTRANAIAALKTRPEEELSDSLKWLAGHSASNYRKSAIYAILQLETPWAAGLLPGLTEDANTEVSQKAVDALLFLQKKGVLPAGSVSPKTEGAENACDTVESERARRARAESDITANRTRRRRHKNPPSQVDLDKAACLRASAEDAPGDLILACYFNYALAFVLAISLFAVIHITKPLGWRFYCMLSIAVGLSLWLVITALSLQAGKEWSRQYTLLLSSFLPVPRLSALSAEVLQQEEVLDFFNASPSGHGVAAKAAALLSLISLLVFVVVTLVQPA